MQGYYIKVAAGSYIGITGSLINYTTQESSSGALCQLYANATLNLDHVSIYKPFTGDNYVSNTASLHENTAIKVKTMTLTLDDNNEADLELNPKNYAVQTIFITGRSGWMPIAYAASNTVTKVKVMSPSSFNPTISDKTFNFTVRYLALSQI
jgi:hypothetical protein